MNAALIRWLAAIIMAMVCAVSFADELSGQAKEKFIGKWDRNAGTVSFFVKEIGGKKQARMLLVDERVDDVLSKLSVEMASGELDDLGDLIRDSLAELETPDSQVANISPLGNKETRKEIGRLIYPEGKLILVMVNPGDTRKYVSMSMKMKDKRFQYAYWMEKEDLVLLRKLIDKTLLSLE